MTRLAVLGICALAGVAIAIAIARGDASEGAEPTKTFGATGTGSIGEVCFSKDAIPVPWTVGLARQRAESVLQASGFEVNMRTAFPQEANPGLPQGIVIKQFPPRGWPNCKGASIALTVN